MSVEYRFTVPDYDILTNPYENEKFVIGRARGDSFAWCDYNGFSNLEDVEKFIAKNPQLVIMNESDNLISFAMFKDMINSKSDQVYAMSSEQIDEPTNSPVRPVSVIRKNTDVIVDVPFISIKEGDTIFVGGEAYVALTNAYYRGEPFEEGYIPDYEHDDASVTSSGGEWDPIELDDKMGSLYVDFSEMDKDLQSQVISCIAKKTKEYGLCEIGEIINIIDSFKKTPLYVQIQSASNRASEARSAEQQPVKEAFPER